MFVMCRSDGGQWPAKQQNTNDDDDDDDTLTWLPILTILQLPTYTLPILSLLLEPYQKLKSF